MNQQARWITRDFVFAAPLAFSNVYALEPERFELRPTANVNGSPCLSVLALDAAGVLDLDQIFSGIASDLLGLGDQLDWLIEPKDLLGRDARRGVGALITEKGEEVVEVLLVRGRDERPWVFGRRSSVADIDLAVIGMLTLLQSLQESPESMDAKLLQSQFAKQERKRLLVADGGDRSERYVPDPSDPVWAKRLAAALAVDEATAAPLITDAIALVEEPYGDPAPLGGSRIGGGPDLPPGAWPTDVRGMRHPFLMQIDLAEVASVCGTMPPLPNAGLLSFFVNGDALLVDVIYTSSGTRLVRFPMTEEIIKASHAAVRLAEALREDAKPGRLPHEEGDCVTAVLEEGGTLTFSHSPDPVWAYGAAGETFDALSDERWACVASARLRPVRTQSIDLINAQERIEGTDTGSMTDLEDIHDEMQRAPAGRRSDIKLPQVHQMLGYASHHGWEHRRQEVTKAAGQLGYADLTTRDEWIVLAQVNADSGTGREFWDALRLTIMIPSNDALAQRWDRCVLLPG